ncbi:TetR/AcrR family transcriptional regulator [Pseudofrankia sp. BMG5.37]|uniref:TetR/AcrR family transcriptional regulator n=1 Tax=Pseudofrankia sp. BMG5.37 TaxID=3050035 RepID=UPI002893924A|nr:TetR/AcrR family transcriptional regulator [Pseudofrankia sp. BMG5.37]MDT3442640.1 TetR/AcrR family transcriptional regulator [Pseudofrankia sp. BMG5.37]
MSTEPTTARGRASRERIVARVADVVAQHGVRAVSLEQVLAVAGASKSQLYHYFGGRDQLMEAAVGYRCDQVLGGLTEAFATVATLDELERTLGGFVAQYEQSPAGCPIGTLASDVAEHNEGARARVAGAFAAWERLFVDAFARMRAAGELRADASPADLGTALLASLEGGMLLSQTRRDGASLRVAVQAALAFVRTFAS